MSDYVQLTLFEVDGEVFTGKPYFAEDTVEVSVPADLAREWEKTATLAAQRQRELGIYYDAALVTRGM